MQNRVLVYKGCIIVENQEDEVSFGTQNTELRVPSVLYVSRTCPRDQSRRKFFVQFGEPICRTLLVWLRQNNRRRTGK